MGKWSDTPIDRVIGFLLAPLFFVLGLGILLDSLELGVSIADRIGGGLFVIGAVALVVPKGRVQLILGRIIAATVVLMFHATVFGLVPARWDPDLMAFYGKVPVRTAVVLLDLLALAVVVAHLRNQEKAQ